MTEPSPPKVLAVIPARYASTRFPGKVIASLAGRPLVAHVYDRTRAARLVGETVVAVDDARAAEVLQAHGVPYVHTRPDHPSGTDRMAEVAAKRVADILVNVQGDEPLMDPATIDRAIEPLLADPELVMATARRRITDPALVADPNVVKVVCGRDGRALYFSRHPIPYVRDGTGEAPPHWQHIGLYVYRRDFLLKYAGMPPSPLECLEKLEQLRVLENGYTMSVVETDYESIGVDTPADLERAAAYLRHRQEGSC